MTRRVDSNEALRRANAMGLTAVEPYPGNTHTPWLLKCAKCGKERRVEVRAFSLLVQGCSCPPTAPSAEQAEGELRKAGYVPLKEYPGTPRASWPALCVECGRECRPSLTRIRSGKICRHGYPATVARGAARRGAGRKRGGRQAAG